MPRQHISVTCRDADPHLLPSWATLPAVLLRDLVERGLVPSFRDRLRIDRKAGGHDGLSVAVALIAFFASGLGVGIRPFWRRMSDLSLARGRGLTVEGQLAALVGRKSMCSPAALSRALAHVDAASARCLYEWLLVDVPGLLPLLNHPSVLMRDAIGNTWHVFDYDPSAKAFRERDLPPGHDDMPPGQRRSKDLATPGYAGRKRGETQYVRAIVSHAGSGAWVFSRLSPGNGNARGDLVAGLEAIVSLLGRMDARRERTLVRLDGAYGNIPAITSLQERGLRFVTRAAHQLMHLPDVQARLAAATWVRCPEAEVSDLRSVAELGMITLEPAEETRRDDGSPFAPVTVRAVVSRIPKSGEARRGVAHLGWQYEVFLTALEPDAWPAADVVSTYHGRSTCENRYAQEDRELGLDRTFSFHPAGQELATVIGMAVWNMLIVQGFRTASPPEVAPQQTPRRDEVDERESTFLAPRTASPESPEPPEPPPVEPAVETDLQRDMAEELARIPWKDVLVERPRWRWDSAGGLRCPDGQSLHPVSVGLGDRAGGQAAAYFGTRAGSCRDCPIRELCMNSTTGKTHKQIGITVSAEQGLRLHALLKRRNKYAARPRMPIRPAPHPLGAHPPSPPRGGHTLHPSEGAPAPGPWHIQHPAFLPAAARHAFRALAGAVHLEIAVEIKPSSPSTCHALVAESRRERRHGRMTWVERQAHYDLPEGSTASITVVGRRTLAAALLGTRRRSLRGTARVP